MKRLAGILIASLSVPILVGCRFSSAGSSSGGTSAGGDSSGTVAQEDKLFLKQADGGFLFSTNDQAYWGSSGYTLWSLSCPSQTPFTQRDVALTKTSGDGYAGYGIVLCEYDSGDADNDETMLVVMINTQQQYSVGEATGSVYTAYTSPTWIQSLSLSRGYGMTNEVKVTRDGTGLFTLYLNGSQAMTFHDGRTPLQSGGGDGYIAVISPQDNFPQTPVTISYTDK